MDPVHGKQASQIGHPLAFKCLEFGEVFFLGPRVTYLVQKRYFHCWQITRRILVLCKNKFLCLWENSHSYIRVSWKTLPEESSIRILCRNEFLWRNKFFQRNSHSYIRVLGKTLMEESYAWINSSRGIPTYVGTINNKTVAFNGLLRWTGGSRHSLTQALRQALRQAASRLIYLVPWNRGLKSEDIYVLGMSESMVSP